MAMPGTLDRQTQQEKMNTVRHSGSPMRPNWRICIMAMADMAPAPRPMNAASKCCCSRLGRSTASTPRKPNSTAVIRTGSRWVPPQPSIQPAMKSGAV
jgi:hypothetical protein